MDTLILQDGYFCAKSYLNQNNSLCPTHFIQTCSEEFKQCFMKARLPIKLSFSYLSYTFRDSQSVIMLLPCIYCLTECSVGCCGNYSIKLWPHQMAQCFQLIDGVFFQNMGITVIFIKHIRFLISITIIPMWADSYGVFLGIGQAKLPHHCGRLTWTIDRRLWPWQQPLGMEHGTANVTIEGGWSIYRIVCIWTEGGIVS